MSLLTSVSHLSHLYLISSFNNLSQPRMILLKCNDFITLIFDLIIPLIIVSLKTLLINNPSLLSQLLILFPQTLPVLLQAGQLSLLVVQ